jgi:CRP-like cAMP-binding protein
MPTRWSFAVAARAITVARPPMTNPLIARLRHLTSLSDDDLDLLGEACTATQHYPARADRVPEGDGTDRLHVVLDGWACRYRMPGDGRRQFPALLVPGDICDLDGFLLRRVHYGIAALTPCTVATLAHARLRAIMDESPAIRDVFWWLTFVENSVSVEWTTGLGRRSATERLAHLLCELLVRLATVGLTEDNGYALPLTQEELADALGVSTVHVNRTLQELRALGLIRLEGRRLTVHDWEGLKDLSGFSPDYLHVERLRPRPQPLHH